jgi:hypothetical protein
VQGKELLIEFVNFINEQSTFSKDDKFIFLKVFYSAINERLIELIDKAAEKNRKVEPVARPSKVDLEKLFESGADPNDLYITDASMKLEEYYFPERKIEKSISNDESQKDKDPDTPEDKD